MKTMQIDIQVRLSLPMESEEMNGYTGFQGRFLKKSFKISMENKSIYTKFDSDSVIQHMC